MKEADRTPCQLPYQRAQQALSLGSLPPALSNALTDAWVEGLQFPNSLSSSSLCTEQSPKLEPTKQQLVSVPGSPDPGQALWALKTLPTVSGMLASGMRGALGSASH